MSKLSETKVKWIALTGLMGSGKSTASMILRKLGYSVLNCDELVHKMYEEKEVIQEIQNICEDDILTENGKIDRAKMAMIIFSDPIKKHQVESFVYPRLRELLYNKKKDNKGIGFVEVPLLFECGWQGDYDEIWLIVADETVAIQRLKDNRNMSDEQIKERLAHQMPASAKKALSHHILDNSTTLESLEKQIKEVLYA